MMEDFENIGNSRKRRSFFLSASAFFISGLSIVGYKMSIFSGNKLNSADANQLRANNIQPKIHPDAVPRSNKHLS